MDEPAEWYWLHEGRAVGPTTRRMIEKLVAGRSIEAESLVSYRGGEWTAAGRTDLAPLIARAPAPLPPLDMAMERRIDRVIETWSWWTGRGMVISVVLMIGGYWLMQARITHALSQLGVYGTFVGTLLFIAAAISFRLVGRHTYVWRNTIRNRLSRNDVTRPG